MSLERVRQLAEQVDEKTARLAEAAELLDPPRLATQPWHQTLVTKVRPQLEEDRFLLVAVVGGTNIGKSAVFNHIAGEAASRVDPRAAGTKHPVLLVPQGFRESRLQTLFPSFTLKPWERDEDPIEASADDLLFWRSSAATPETLLVLDTPDVDSDQEVNWDRADRIRRAADLLVCVLTSQKYNDHDWPRPDGKEPYGDEWLRRRSGPVELLERRMCVRIGGFERPHFRLHKFTQIVLEVDGIVCGLQFSQQTLS